MIKYIFIFVVLFVLLTFQGGLVDNLGFGAFGNVILLYTIITAILGSFEESFFTVLVGGLMLDLVSGTLAGLGVISLFAVFGATVFLVTRLTQKEPNRLILLLCVTAGTAIYTFVFAGANQLLASVHLTRSLDLKFVLERKLLLDLLVNIILVYPFLYLYNLTQNLKQKLERISA